VTGELALRLVNHTGHKLPSGYPEGRRMFLNVRAYRADVLVFEVNPYDDEAATLRGLPGAPSSPALRPSEVHVGALVYEQHMSSTLTGEAVTFHFVHSPTTRARQTWARTSTSPTWARTSTSLTWARTSTSPMRARTPTSPTPTSLTPARATWGRTCSDLLVPDTGDGEVVPGVPEDDANESGCGCAAASRGEPGAGLLLVAVVTLARRRRRGAREVISESSTSFRIRHR
jgi:MYXO-CTERM domain-containing protein